LVDGTVAAALVRDDRSGGVSSVVPTGLARNHRPYQGLTPWAKLCRSWRSWFKFRCGPPRSGFTLGSMFCKRVGPR